MRSSNHAPRGPRANPGVMPAYRTAAPAAPVDLWLAGNEGRPPESLDLAIQGGSLGRYPSTGALERMAADRFGVAPSQVVATAGADDALLRLALGYLFAGREIVLPTPTFVMIERYARLAGGSVIEVPWRPGTPYPTDAVLDAATDATALIAVVSPNNPTGAVASPRDVRRIGEGVPGALVVVDGAYAEFADVDLTPAALELENGVALRTLSKAYGCAGLRVGFAIGPERVIEVLRAAGNPYPCATPSIVAAKARMAMDVTAFRERVAAEREALGALLRRLGLVAFPSEGNFVYAEAGPELVLGPGKIAELLTGFGIAVRAFPGTDEHPAALRITCPGDEQSFERLVHALGTALAPEAILFDMDGVLADVSSSYRTAIIETARAFGVTVTAEEVEERKAQGSANDDWALTHELMANKGVEKTLQEVTDRFEDLYQGTAAIPGLRKSETLLLSREALKALRERWPLGIVTGRPRRDALAFLEEQGIGDLFGAVVTREDAALKPDPGPTARALELLGVSRGWLLGDTPDDILSARGAGVLGIGVLAPGAAPGALSRSLSKAGAGTVLPSVTEISGLLLPAPSAILP